MIPLKYRVQPKRAFGLFSRCCARSCTAPFVSILQGPIGTFLHWMSLQPIDQLLLTLTWIAVGSVS